MPDVPTIAARIAAVQERVEAVQRERAQVETRTGSNYGYDYISEAAMFDFLRPLLAEHGIATSPPRAAVTHRDGNLVEVTVEVDFISTDNPDDRLTGSMPAQATDKGDKQLAKAITSATRYLYWKTFRFPSHDPAADPEASSSPHETAADRQAAQLLGKLRELAKRKGAVGAVAAAVTAHKEETGLVTPHPDFTRGLIAQLEALPDVLRPDAAPTPGDAPATAENGAQAPEVSGPLPGAEGAPVDDPFSVLDGATSPGPAGPITDEQKQQIIAIVTGDNGLKTFKPQTDWDAKIAAKCAEWYDGHSDWTTLTKDQAADLATRLESVRLGLAEMAKTGAQS